MVHKIGTVKQALPFMSLHPKIAETIMTYALILDEFHGADRDVDHDDGGYILYVEKGTSNDELRQYFDYTEWYTEFVHRIDSDPQFVVAVYVTSNDFGVVIVISEADAPVQLLSQIKEEKEND